MKITNELMKELFNMEMLMFMLMIILMVNLLTRNSSSIHPMEYFMYTMYYTILMISIIMLKKKIMFAMLTIIIIIGGLMIMYLYFISSMNDLNTSIMNKNIKQLIKLLIIMFLIYNITLKMNLNNESWMIICQQFMFNKMIIKLYMYPYSMMTYLSLIYIMLTLILSIKLSLNKNKPLRKMKM